MEILCRTDTQGSPISTVLNDIRPGQECYLKAMGGLRLRFEQHRVTHEGRQVNQIGLLAGGTGERETR